MPTPTLEPIATTTLASAAASITLNSIPGTYTDIRLVFTFRGATTTCYYYARLNGTASQNVCGQTWMKGDGSSATSGRTTNSDLYYSNGSATTTIPFMETVDFLRYAGSQYKTMLYAGSGDKNGSGEVRRGVAMFPSTSAISSITFYAVSDNFAAGSSMTLYGIKAA